MPRDTLSSSDNELIMSIYYSKYDLNTYKGTPYFHAHIPMDFPTSIVLNNARSFHRLPPNLYKLATLAKRWAIKHYGWPKTGMPGIEEYYDKLGNELNPETRKPLTDKEIDEQWNEPADTSLIVDIPMPEGGFADPDTWEEPPPESDTDYDGPTEESLFNDIESMGREYVAKDHSIPIKGIRSDRQLVQAILVARGAPSHHTPSHVTLSKPTLG